MIFQNQKLNFILLFLFLSVSGLTQNIFVNDIIDGYWEGAIIQNNAATGITADFFRKNDSLFVKTNIKEWVYYPPATSFVTVEDNLLSFETYYGKAEMIFDSSYTEMIGTSGLLSFHLKKSLEPPKIRVEEKTIDLVIDGINIKAILRKPKDLKGPYACAIFVHGRGCGSRFDLDGRADKLAEYGIATLTFDKRGAPGTEAACEALTMDDHSKDLADIIRQVIQLPEIDSFRVGLIANSAGGWVATKAAAGSDQRVAFIVSVVGPSTSVKQQQLDCCRYYVKNILNGTEEMIEQALEYTLLEFEDGDPEIIYAKMMDLLVQGEKSGWDDVLVESDIPSSPEELDKLWVRRNRYDPADDLKSFEGPFLAVLGSQDDIVPLRENVAQYQKLFSEAGKENYQIFIIPNAGHGLEHGHVIRDLGYIRKWNLKATYVKMDRVAPGAFQAMIDFLRNYDYLP